MWRAWKMGGGRQEVWGDPRGQKWEGGRMGGGHTLQPRQLGNEVGARGGDPEAGTGGEHTGAGSQGVGSDYTPDPFPASDPVTGSRGPHVGWGLAMAPPHPCPSSLT